MSEFVMSTEWLPESLRCWLGIWAGDQCATEHESLLEERKVSDKVLVDGYPLAEWLVANWWRLRWEPEKKSLSKAQALDWELSHNLASVGGGIVWPTLRIQSDGEFILLRGRPTKGVNATLKYLNNFDEYVRAVDFEAAVDGYVEQVLSRLGAQSEERLGLEAFWKQVCAEREDQQLCLRRRLEARLGFDVGEADTSLLERLVGSTHRFGANAVEEVATTGSVSTVDEMEKMYGLLESSQWRIRVDVALSGGSPAANGSEKRLPWQVATQYASEVRAQLGLGREPLSDQRFADVLQAPVKMFSGDTPSGIPWSAALNDSNGSRVFFSSRHPENRRFAAARVMAEQICKASDEPLIPVTKTYTARQKFQRAFAQEFLCPYEGLIEWMDTDNPDNELIEKASEHFSVSPFLVTTLLVNKGHLGRSSLQELNA